MRDPAAEKAWQARLGITPPYLLYLGQWKAYKNLPVLLEAFAQVRRQVPSVQLVLAGDDPRHPEVRAAAARLPSDAVVFPGHLPDAAVPDLYRGAALVVLPSRAEGFGLPVIEALACGVRVACSDLPVLREIAEGIAVFCDPQDPNGFARAIVEALTDPAPDVRERGIVRARTYTWRQAARDTARVYETALSGSVRVPLEENAGGGEEQDLEVQGE
ncbi:MAG TPA: glycosyltransferase family 1 protein [Candidatus Sulfotelmatobacter sp.]|nr:glycosyltransferase family 1 protein [Candidatus Sulfotelmatobacter sp.]